MITLRKLSSLPTGTRKRKTVRLLVEFEARLRDGRGIEGPYLRELSGMMVKDIDDPVVTTTAEALRDVLSPSGPGAKPELLRRVNDLRHALLRHLGEEPAEWDLVAPLDSVRRSDGPRPCPPEFRPTIYLEDLRSPFNVGAVFRSAEAFCVERILISPGTPSPEGSRARRSSMGCVDRLAWERRSLDELTALGFPLFALETGGQDIDEFDFPSDGIVLVGNEELGLSRDARRLTAGRICTIPLSGGKASLNVGVSVGILLYAWWRSYVSDGP